jgi:hypothetical protein
MTTPAAINDSIIELYSILLEELHAIPDDEISERTRYITTNHKLRNYKDMIILRALLCVNNNVNYENEFLKEPPLDNMDAVQNYEVMLIKFARYLVTIPADHNVVLFNIIYASIDLARKDEPLKMIAYKHTHFDQKNINELFQCRSRNTSMCIVS